MTPAPLTRALRRSLLLIGLCAALTTAADEPRTLGPFDAECQVAFRPDGKALAVTVRGGSAALIDLGTGRRTVRYAGTRQEGGSSIAFSPDGSRLAVATAEGMVRIYEAQSGKELAICAHGGHLRTVAFLADGKALITAGDRPLAPDDTPDPAAPTARIWSAATGAKELDVDGRSPNTSSGAAAAPAGRLVAVVRGDGKLGLYDLAAKKRVEVELGEPSHVGAFSPDGKLLAVLGGKDAAELTLIDVHAGKVQKTLGKRAAAKPAPDGALAFTPDGKQVARIQRGAPGVALWDLASSERRELATPPAASLSFAPDGKLLAVGLRSGKVLLLDPSKATKTP
ncbi:MAG: WD40 repeat domain-containing protein [Planctomycetota bacterium]